MLMERSPYFQNMVFVKANTANGALSETENGILVDMYAKAMAMWQPIVYIYLRSNPKACLKRIQTRSRECESKIKMDYLESLHSYHEAAYVEAIRTGMRVFVIDVEGHTADSIAFEINKILKAWFPNGMNVTW